MAPGIRFFILDVTHELLSGPEAFKETEIDSWKGDLNGFLTLAVVMGWSSKKTVKLSKAFLRELRKC